MNLFLIISNFALDIFFPKKCVGCGKAGNYLCFSCSKEVELILTSTCPRCGKLTELGKFCQRCQAHTNLSGLLIAARYDIGPTKELIHHLKYSGFTELANTIGELIVISIQNNLPKGELVVVPVPLFQKKENIRGFNQAELIARYISKKLNLPGGSALERIRDTKTQVGLDREERIMNLRGAFRCADGELIKNKTVLLIDDITTSGTTLEECAIVLKKSGAKRVIGVAAAKRI